MDAIVLVAVIGGIAYVLYKYGGFGDGSTGPQPAGGIGAGGTTQNPAGYTGIGSGPYLGPLTGTGARGEPTPPGFGSNLSVPITGSTANGNQFTALTMGPGSQGVTGLSVNGSFYNVTDPIGPGGQTIGELLGAPGSNAWTLSDVADYIAISGV